VPGVFAVLAAVKFDGWAIVELDEVPDKARTPKESGEISKRYLRRLGLI
jgi:inosose dehydratase